MIGWTNIESTLLAGGQRCEVKSVLVAFIIYPHSPHWLGTGLRTGQEQCCCVTALLVSGVVLRNICIELENTSITFTFLSN